jgi:hypothetical protein
MKRRTTTTRTTKRRTVRKTTRKTTVQTAVAKAAKHLYWAVAYMEKAAEAAVSTK